MAILMASRVDPDWQSLMPHKVTITPRIGKELDGRPKFGKPVTVRARVRTQNRNVRMASGQETVSTSRVILDGVVGVTEYDQVLLPDGRTPPILQVTRVADEKSDLYEAIDLA